LPPRNIRKLLAARHRERRDVAAESHDSERGLLLLSTRSSPIRHPPQHEWQSAPRAIQ
jgi:hypothetical protein